MVGTRQSLPTSCDGALDAGTPDEQLTRKQQAALKKLHIDAHNAILGNDAPAPPCENTKRVYHYRGTAYEITGHERPEWLEQEPGRYKKRKDGEREEEEERDEAEDGRPDRKRRRSTDPQTSPTGAKRRQRSVSGLGHSRDVHRRGPRASDSLRDGVEQDADGRRRARVRRAGDAPVYDGGHHVPALDIRDAREAAAKRGYQVAPIPEQVLSDNFGKSLALAIAKLAFVNSQVDKLIQRYNACADSLNAERRREAQKPTQRSTPHPPVASNARPASAEVEIAHVATRHDSAANSPLSPKHDASTSGPSAALAQGGEERGEAGDGGEPGDPVRAEEALFHGMLDKETASAKRHRVQQEIEMVHGWAKADQRELAAAAAAPAFAA